MISLGLRLVLSGGREAVIRFLVLAAAVGLGVGLLLTVVAATNAVSTWNNRHAWFLTGTVFVPPGPATAGIAPLWWHPIGDTFDRQNIYRFDVAATGTRPHWPRCCAAPRRTNWPTATLAAWRARSATPRCHRRTRWSSSSGALRRS